MIRNECKYYTGDEDCDSCAVRGYILDCTGCPIDRDGYNQLPCLHCGSMAEIEYRIRTGGDDDE